MTSTSLKNARSFVQQADLPEIPLSHCSGKVIINAAVLNDLKAKLVRHSCDYVKKLPELDV